ncbi:transposase [Shewanella baltica]|uniref:Transposase IS3/IS911 family protein n=1 Tax=Shewanella baltica (strain OS195) TaxID=399599 RepID=A9L078_SHEB9|nr:transposase IS3/IS911 family protein [Shewanella baltica OS185]ABX47807.1 transposase IS3/IS911 family protein [Shewanella baltica OS195]ADT92829.1 transposase IS3/IS911 family protein [Shewanella baltica OS678]AEG09982.1 transposase IS3/IS911 family protein [Shewanella baltica BA175]EHC06077.1 transposase IS3/IS911 family protein [Shewanella baltica OS625]KZK68744.1 transposase [Shewanella baltica]
MSLKKSNKSYPQAFKDEAVLMVLKRGYSVTDVAKSLGICASLLHHWKGKHEALQQRMILGESERDELKRLRRENKELRIEKEILIKARAFFSREIK